jgi:hypothetical protein
VYDLRVLDALAAAIDDLDVPVDAETLAAGVALWDRLGAKLAGATGDFDAAGLWELDGSTSCSAWLRSRCKMTNRAATRFATRGRRLRQLPVLARAAESGTMADGQVEATLAGINDRCAEVFAEHEDRIVPTLAPLSPGQCARAMWAWRAHAQPDGSEPDSTDRSLYLSPTLDGRYVLDASLDAAAGAVVATAVDLAITPDADGEPERSPARRRADALVEVCRFFLDHHDAVPAGRRRPHLNVVVDIEDLVGGTGGSVVGGPRLDAAAISALACDSVVHRAVFAGRSAVLDYGSGTRTISAALWNALVVRDECCRFPGCNRRASWCEAHHVVWFSAGGPTAIDNLVLVCSRHHHLLHQPGWSAKLDPDATLVVTDPRGVVRTTAPPRAGPTLCHEGGGSG